MTGILSTTIGPSVVEKIKATKVESTTINNQEAIFEAVQRYITLEQKDPDNSGGTSALQKVINQGYLNANANNNGFGGTYSIVVDNTKGILKVQTSISDAKAQTMFLNSFKNKFKPNCIGGLDVKGVCTSGDFETEFVIPMNVKHGSGLFMTGIPIGDNAPTNDSKYWYDTCKGLATLKMKADNGTWKVVAMGGGSSISEDSLYSSGSVNSKEDIKASTGSYIGETKYAYDSTINTIQEYVYTGDATKGNNGWVIKGSGVGLLEWMVALFTMSKSVILIFLRQ
jgi:type II secretory pathway pseudopilin PulG